MKIQDDKLRALREELRTIRSIDAPEPMSAGGMSLLQDLLETDVSLVHGLTSAFGGERHRISFLRSHGPVPQAFGSMLSAYVDEHPRWGAYDPASPEPDQRNVVVTATAAQMKERRVPVAVELFPKIGLDTLHQIRLLVCEGPSLLAWVGGWRAEPFGRKQAASLQAILPDLQRRFSTVRLLARGGRQAAFDAALDAIGRAAFLVSEGGHVLEANPAGAEILAREQRSLRTELARAVSSRAVHPRWRVTRVQSVGQGDEWLIVAQPWTGERVARVIREATARWSLTPRQRDVLAELAEGSSNDGIAAALNIAVRTVEVHVTALLERAQVESRAELIVKLYRLE
ncbi:MAG: helix-turn-helix transcriptional regulator [Polyangiaceae bacterium]